MRSSSAGATTVGRLRTSAGDRFVDFLQRTHPRKTAENVSADTGCSVAAVAKWIERRSLPKGSGFLALVSAYGPEFLTAIMHSPPDWLSEAQRAARLRALESEIALRRAEVEALRG